MNGLLFARNRGGSRPAVARRGRHRPGGEHPVPPPDQGGGLSRRDVNHRARRIVVEHPEMTDTQRFQLLRDEYPLMPPARLERLLELETSDDLGYGALDQLLDDPTVTEVMVNGPGEVWIERQSQLVRSGVVLSRHELQVTIERIIDPLGLRVDQSSPFVDGRLRDGSRVHIVVPPLAPDGPLITIRRFDRSVRTVDQFGPPPLAALLGRLVAERATMVVTGGTSTGKTTLVAALAAFFDPAERVILLEDTAELALPGEHVARLEVRPPNSEGVGGVDLRALIRNALRMRPDRLIVGEVRGSEALDLILALNTGHRGSLATCHANSAPEALLRLETLAGLGAGNTSAVAIRRQLVGAIDVIIEVERTFEAENHQQTRRIRRVVHVSPNHAQPDALRLRELWPA